MAADWIFEDNTLTKSFGDSDLSGTYEIEKDKLIFIRPVQTLNYEILKLNRKSLKLKLSDDPYFPEREIHLEKLK